MGAANDYHDSRIPTSVDGVEPAGHCPTKPFFQERTHMGLLKEFKEFAVKGNAIDMAVGIVIGAAFGKIVTLARQGHHDAAAGPAAGERGFLQLGDPVE